MLTTTSLPQPQYWTIIRPLCLDTVLTIKPVNNLQIHYITLLLKMERVTAYFMYHCKETRTVRMERKDSRL